MKATLKNGTVISGTPEEFRVFFGKSTPAEERDPTPAKPEPKATAPTPIKERRPIAHYAKRGVRRAPGNVPGEALCVPVTIDGIEYESMTAAADVMGVAPSTISRWVNQGYVSPHNKNSRKPVPVIVKGKLYDSMSAAARANSVTPTTIRWWIGNGQAKIHAEA